MCYGKILNFAFSHLHVCMLLQALHYKKYSTASDVWSFGCLMYEIWSLGHKPFETHTNPEVDSSVTHRGCQDK